MAYTPCSFIRTEGMPCGSPALRHNDLCYYHHRMEIRQRRRERIQALNDFPAVPGLELPLLEDAEAIQVAINEVLNALVDGRIEHHRASLLLYGLQLASSNCGNSDLRFERSRGIVEVPEDRLLGPAFGVSSNSLPPKKPAASVKALPASTRPKKGT